MTPATTLSESGEGKKVVDTEGKGLGRILEVIGSRAFVKPDPAPTDSVLSGTGRGSRDDGTFALGSDRVTAITADEVVLDSE